MGGVVTEEKAISCAQYLDLVYSKMGTCYNLIPDAPRPSTKPTPKPPVASHATNGVINTFHAKTESSPASHTNPKSHNSNAQSTPTPTPSTSKMVEVNYVQSMSSRRSTNKKKGMGKNKEDKNNNLQSDKEKTQTIDEKDKHKPRYPFIICGDDHYTKDFPIRAEVTKFLQGRGKPSTPSILSLPFPSQQHAQMVIHDQSTPSTSSYVLMCIGNSKKNEVAIVT
jgi:hypothetical protein